MPFALSVWASYSGTRKEEAVSSQQGTALRFREHQGIDNKTSGFFSDFCPAKYQYENRYSISPANTFANRERSLRFPFHLRMFAVGGRLL